MFLKFSQTLPNLNHLTDLNRLCRKIIQVRVLLCTLKPELENLVPKRPQIHVSNFRVNFLVLMY